MDDVERRFGWRGVENQVAHDEDMKRYEFKVPNIVFPKRPESLRNDYLRRLEAERDGTGGFEWSGRTRARDVSPDEKRMIYEGISRDLQGRWKYLNTRKRYKPEEKYAFPVTSSMSYGWQLYDENNRRFAHDPYGNTEESGLVVPSKQHGIKNYVMNTFYRPNGVAYEDLRDDEVIKNRKAPFY